MLNKVQLATSIENAFKANITGISPQQSTEITTLANTLANAIDTYVRGIGITYIAGLANSGGPVTGTFTYTIS